MSIFDRFRRKENAFQINDVKPTVTFGWKGLRFFDKKWEFANFYLTLITTTLYDGISNITFRSRKQVMVPDEICDFIDRNASLLVNNMLTRGFIAVSWFKRDNVVRYYIPQENDIKKDDYGRVINANTVVVYSTTYQLHRQSDFFVIRPQLDLLNTLCNTLVNSADSMGVLPIIWGSSIPANPAFKEELEAMMSRNYGWDSDKYKYFLSRQEIHTETIDLKVKDLELAKNIEDTFGFLCRYFGVPTDLILGKSTFDNVGEAKKFFYDTTIRKWAEILLKVSRSLLTATGDFVPQDTITYNLDNVAELETTLSSACREKDAYIDSLLKLKDAGIDVQDELAKVYIDMKRMYVEV